MSGPSHFDFAAWSPDSIRVAFVDQAGLHVARADGSRARILAKSSSADAAWSPDSKLLAFSVNGGPGTGIHVIRADGSRDHRIVNDAVSELAWSPDGRWIVFVPEARPLSVIRPSGIGRRLLPLSGAAPSWSANGKWLGVVRAIHGNSNPGQLDVISFPSGRTRVISDHVRSFAWSPKGAQLAFTTSSGARSPGEFQVASAGAFRRRTLAKGTIAAFAWAPDASRIAYLDDTEGVQVATVAGRTRTVISPEDPYGGSIESFAWVRPASGVRYRPPAPTDGVYTGSPVTALAADGARVAFATCEHVSVWTPSTNALIEGPGCGPSIRFPVGTLAIAGDRVAFGIHGGGNTTDWALFGMSLDPLSWVPVANHRDTCCFSAPQVAGAGSLLLFDAPVSRRYVPNDRFQWEIRKVGHPGCECPLVTSFEQSAHVPLSLDVDAGRILIVHGDSVQLRNEDGVFVSGFAIATDPSLPDYSAFFAGPDASLAGADVVVRVAGEILDYDATSGTLRHRWPLAGIPPPSTYNERALQDVSRSLAAYVVDGQLHVLRLSDGVDTIVGYGTMARFSDDGLAYVDGVRIHVVPFDRLPVN